MGIYFWQDQQYLLMQRLIENNKLPHALLFLGEQGLAKSEFAMHLAKDLLCYKSQKACGSCGSCLLWQQDWHPDCFHHPEEDTSIKIDSIHNLIEFLQQTSQQGAYKVAILQNINTLTESAANALLKTLEEPLGESVILMTATNSTNLLPTIVSRCQKVTFMKPDFASTVDWIKQQGEDFGKFSNQQYELAYELYGTPLTIQSNLQDKMSQHVGLIECLLQAYDPIKLAQEYQQIPVEIIIRILEVLITDLVKLKMQGGDYISLKSYKTALSDFANKIELSNLFTLREKVFHILELLQSKIQLNKLLLLENLFITWQTLIS
ncbi:MAG: DNA polymerase III subunit delta' [Thiotrichales bacterium]|nr:MAG: DNA polymerase III subunit delta' [Thiotrichales bacterium]